MSFLLWGGVLRRCAPCAHGLYAPRFVSSYNTNADHSQRAPGGQLCTSFIHLSCPFAAVARFRTAQAFTLQDACGLRWRWHWCCQRAHTVRMRRSKSRRHSAVRIGPSPPFTLKALLHAVRHRPPASPCKAFHKSFRRRASLSRRRVTPPPRDGWCRCRWWMACAPPRPCAGHWPMGKPWTWARPQASAVRTLRSRRVDFHPMWSTTGSGCAR